MPIKGATDLKGRHELTVNSEDFADFLREKTPDSVCPACGMDEWTVICPDPDESINAFRMRLVLQDGPRPASLSALAIYCDNCGYIRCHASRTVRKWVDARQFELDLQSGDDSSEGYVDEQ